MTRYRFKDGDRSEVEVNQVGEDQYNVSCLDRSRKHPDFSIDSMGLNNVFELVTKRNLEVTVDVTRRYYSIPVEIDGEEFNEWLDAQEGNDFEFTDDLESGGFASGYKVFLETHPVEDLALLASESGEGKVVLVEVFDA